MRPSGGNNGPAGKIIAQADALLQAGRLDEAEEELKRKGGVALKDPIGINVMASILLRRTRPAEALKLLDNARKLAPRLPDTQLQRGMALAELGRTEEAAEALSAYVTARPDDPAGWTNLSGPLAQLGRLEEADVAVSRALRAGPRRPETVFNRAFLRLISGDLPEGFRDFEARWEMHELKPERPAVAAPLWDGSPLAGRRLLVHAEQGIGDTLQFLRFLRDPRLADGRVSLRLDARLHRLVAAALPEVRLLELVDPDETYDLRLPVMSLARVLGTTLDTIPAEVPYLAAETDLRRLWRDRLGDAFRVAVAWQGNPAARTDRGRSIPLSAFAPLAVVPGVRLVSLQKNAGTEQIDGARFDLATFDDLLDTGPDAFVDTAAIIAEADLVVTSDTAVAHLAGGLGRPVWVVLKRVPDWRWLMGRDDSPWYPTMRLFRQEVAGDWAGVMARVAAALGETVAAARAA